MREQMSYIYIRYGFGADAVLALVRTNRHSTGAYKKHEISDSVLRMPTALSSPTTCVSDSYEQTADFPSF